MKRSSCLRKMPRNMKKPRIRIGLEDLLVNCFRAKALEVCSFNRTYAANILGINVRTVRLWILEMADLGYQFPTDSGGGDWKKRTGPTTEQLNEITRFATAFIESLHRRHHDSF